jgi:1-deoxy-D-xylulose-5-phosphate synthase
MGRTLLHLAERNKKIVALTPAMPTGSGLIPMMERFPDRCLDVGIAEQHAVTLAAGMATQGLLPFCVIYSTFLQRAYDQILHDVALQNLKVVFCVDRAGLVGHDGPTHHGLFDIAYLRSIPNLEMAAPKDAKSLQNLLFTAQKGLDHPLVIRYPRGYSECESVDFNLKTIPWGKGIQLKQGSQIAVLTVGTLAGVVQQAIEKSTDPRAFAHFDLMFIKPLDHSLLDSIAKRFQALIVFEEGVIHGGAGSAVLEYLGQKKDSLPIQLEGIPDRFVSHGTPQLLQKEVGLDLDSISQKLSLLLNKIKGTPSV